MQRYLVITYVKHLPEIHCEFLPILHANEKVRRWTNLLYVNNLKWVNENTFGENCLPQTWWVATELFPNILLLLRHDEL